MVGLYTAASRCTEAVSLRVVSPTTISISMDVSASKGPFDSSQRPDL